MLRRIWKRWNWLDDGLIPLAAVLMHAAWIYPLFVLYLRAPDTGAPFPRFSFLLCAGLLAGGAVVGRVASGRRMGWVIATAGGLLATLATLFATALPAGAVSPVLVVPSPLVVVVFAVVAWWRGLCVARCREGREATGAFIVGVVALSGLLVLALLLPSDPQAEVDALGSSLRLLVSCLVPSLLFGTILAAFLEFLAHGEDGWGRVLGQVAVVLGLLSVGLVLPFGPSRAAALSWVLLFMFSGLAALALRNISRTLREQTRRSGRPARVERYWVFTALSTVAGLLLLGAAIGIGLAPDATLGALVRLRPVWVFVVRVVFYITLPFAYLFFGLIEPWLPGILNWLSVDPSRLRGAWWRPQGAEEPMAEAAEDLPVLYTLTQVLLALAAIAAVVLLFCLAMRHGRRTLEQKSGVVERRETVLSAGLLKSQLAALFDRLRRPPRHPLFVDPGPLGDPRRAIREMYQQVLAGAMALNAPRRAGETPQAYVDTLLHLCPGQRGALEALTGAYVQARYSLSSLSQAQVSSARDAFAHIDAALHARTQMLANDRTDVDRPG